MTQTPYLAHTLQPSHSPAGWTRKVLRARARDKALPRTGPGLQWGLERREGQMLESAVHLGDRELSSWAGAKSSRWSEPCESK